MLAVLALPSALFAESIETSLRTMLKALDTGDRVTFQEYSPSKDIGFPVQVFDYDLDNQPVTYEGVEAVNHYVDSLFAEMAKRRVHLLSEISHLQTGSRSPELGFAIFELDQTMTADGESERVRFRMTMLMTQHKTTGRWRVFHLHATLLSPTLEIKQRSARPSRSVQREALSRVDQPSR